MEFGSIPVAQAQGAILAHSLSLPSGKRIRKGSKITQELINEISQAGVKKLIAARLSSDDVFEDEAAAKIAEGMSSINIRMDEARTGRVNFFAKANGVFRVSSTLIDAINAIDPSITIATLNDFTQVNTGRIVATIKIIPYAIANKTLEAVMALDLSKVFSISPYQNKRVGLIATQLPTLKPATMDKTRQNLENRLVLSGSRIVQELRVSHDTAAIADAIKALQADCDMLIIFGASAISDVRDVIPSAIEFTGGDIFRFGMPVDPGNLLLLATLQDVLIIGAPGCARSPAENGFDWVLQRLLADIPLSDINIEGLGVGGLLMETGSRPHSRIQSSDKSSAVPAIILAAGQSRRMGSANKMTVEINGKPMLRHVVEAALGSKSDDVKLVTGHKSNESLDALNGLEVEQVHNRDYSDGLSTSLAAGISALPENTSAAIVMLGDMPFVTSDMINQMLKAGEENPGHIIMATHDGKRGNPVLWPARFFDELCQISGDVGARHIIGENADFVIEVELGRAASLDLDTPESINLVQN